MTAISLPSPATLSLGPTVAPERQKLKDAARQFEAIFARQMLSAARKADFGGNDLFGSQAMDTFRQMQDERFADIAAERGVFGIGKMLEAQLARQVSPAGPAEAEG